MKAQIIDGKALAAEIKEPLAQEIQELKKHQITPGLAVILVGDNPASQVYVKNKEKGCLETGIHSIVIRLPQETTQAELLKKIAELNENSQVHGILVQLPLPSHINETVVMNAVDPEKDADGLHPFNMGRMLIGLPGLLPCTPAGVIEMIKSTGIDMTGKEAVMLGHSNIVGKPTAVLMLRENATVTICHIKTQNLAQVCRRADILVVAVGKAHLITPDFVKPGAVVIDVGINRLPDGKLVGDVDFEAVGETAGFITPVPGGVGPMTIAMLLKNVVDAAKKNLKHRELK